MSKLTAQLDAPSPKGLQELGGAWDAAVFDECRRFTTLDETQKQAVRDQMSRDRSWAIVSWAEGMATLAVREGDRQRILYGLVGLSLFDSDEIDARDVQVVYPLFVRAAERIGEDADELTGAAAHLTDSVGRRWLLALLPARGHRVERSHVERGSGRDFRFERVGTDWDPEAELADFAEGDREQ
jgi:hypothetical protein